jgi:hypothetical protein
MDDDTLTDFDASQAFSPPRTTWVDIDAGQTSATGSLPWQSDATSVVTRGSSSTTEAGTFLDATSSATTFEGGVTVSVMHDSGAAGAAVAAGDARAGTGIGTAAGGDGGSCDGGQALCGGRCVDTDVDPLACGACDHDCLGGSCALGRCQPVVVASDLSDAVGLAVDGSNAYFSAAGVVYECAADGCGNSPTPLADYQDAIGAVAVDATTVYWTTADSVMACDIAGCGDLPTALATDLANPWGIAVDATRVYWAGYDDGTVAWLPLAGGSGSTIVGGASPQYVAVDSERVYFTDVGDGTSGGVSAWAGGTRPPVVLAMGASPNGIATDGTSVFWTAGNTANPGATVNACAIGGCSGAPEVLASDPGTPQRIAVDASGLYWANGDVYVLRAGSHTPVALTSGQTATDIALDDGSVYWIEVGPTEDSVMRVAK